MARKGSKNDTAWKGFANVPFNAEARARYEAEGPPENVVYQQLEEMIGGGYRITFSYDKSNDAYQCSVTCQDDKSPNSGLTMTARGPSWWDALSVAMFKHFTLSEGVWPSSEKTLGDKWG